MKEKFLKFIDKFYGFFEMKSFDPENKKHKPIRKNANKNFIKGSLLLKGLSTIEYVTIKIDIAKMNEIKNLIWSSKFKSEIFLLIFGSGE